ncbi:hypothetical protein FRACYDRAFT_244139 [Fragilariopsis cylindrus CCMP1102]|uniref:Uncharacterized protein n=1 Tax=Fragilariopsis cylindrus CCMP1102 TaxID=635003 RepID=A0A1E7F406_9STRA|nr:hypothetical protein FRACYDRAFT_244139 [Fragilariopsis cylindrus CCMP1102]|eukprot:OEU12866.1 hypothetical protein FRACYDRAFT_244139 [Fragilariopsis cylindrus CCMP1102]
MYKVPIRWYDLSLLCLGCIPGLDFGALSMCSSHWKVVNDVMQTRTWENGPFGGNELSQTLLFGTQHTWYGRSIILTMFAMCAFWAVLCIFYCSPTHPTTHKHGKCLKYCWRVLTICIYERYLGVQTMVQFLFLLLWQPISEWHFWAWKYDMLAKMQCLCSGGKNKVSMRESMILGSSPTGMGWMTGWYFGAPYWF